MSEELEMNEERLDFSKRLSIRVNEERRGDLRANG